MTLPHLWPGKKKKNKGVKQGRTRRVFKAGCTCNRTGRNRRFLADVDGDVLRHESLFDVSRFRVSSSAEEKARRFHSIQNSNYLNFVNHRIESIVT